MTTSNNNTKRNTIFTVDFIKKTITGTKTAFNKAGHISEPEYAELAALVSHHPDFTLVIKEPKKRTTKKKESYSRSAQNLKKTRSPRMRVFRETVFFPASSSRKIKSS